MYEYQLSLPHEHEAFCLGIELTIIELNPVPTWTVRDLINEFHILKDEINCFLDDLTKS